MKTPFFLVMLCLFASCGEVLLEENQAYFAKSCLANSDGSSKREVLQLDQEVFKVKVATFYFSGEDCKITSLTFASRHQGKIQNKVLSLEEFGDLVIVDENVSRSFKSKKVCGYDQWEFRTPARFLGKDSVFSASSCSSRDLFYQDLGYRPHYHQQDAEIKENVVIIDKDASSELKTSTYVVLSKEETETYSLALGTLFKIKY